MAECPNPECRQNVEGLRHTVYGKDGMHGLVACIKDKVPKKWLWTGFTVLGLPLFITGIKVWSGQESDALRYAPLGRVVELERRQDIADERYTYICDALKKIEAAQEEMRHELRGLYMPRASGGGVIP